MRLVEVLLHLVLARGGALQIGEPISVRAPHVQENADAERHNCADDSKRLQPNFRIARRHGLSSWCRGSRNRPRKEPSARRAGGESRNSDATCAASSELMIHGYAL